MEKRIVPVGPIDANCIVLWPSAAQPTGGKVPCWLIDPGADAEDLIAICEKAGLEPVLVALTHGHFDHIGAIPGLLARWPGLPVHISPGDAEWAFSRANAWVPYYGPVARPASVVEDLVDGATLAAGGLSATVVATPGHTPGGVCLHVPSERMLFTGDTLFAGSCGRTDFPGGSMSQLQASLRRLAELPAETVVTPGHGGETTIGREIESNPYLV